MIEHAHTIIASGYLLHPLGYCVGSKTMILDCKGYNSWSGILSDIGEYTVAGSVIGTALAAWKHVNCEHPGCPLPGHRHPGHGRPVCRKHYHSEEADPRHDAKSGSEDLQAFNLAGEAIDG